MFCVKLKADWKVKEISIKISQLEILITYFTDEKNKLRKECDDRELESVLRDIESDLQKAQVYLTDILCVRKFNFYFPAGYKRRARFVECPFQKVLGPAEWLSCSTTSAGKLELKTLQPTFELLCSAGNKRKT